MPTNTSAKKDAFDFALLRLWAANVRDRQVPHAHISDHHAALAGTLCRLLDLRGRVQARNARASIEDSVLAILRELLAAGVVPPKFDARGIELW